jgi:hypothetical protein
MSEFEKLIGELEAEQEQLAKSMSAEAEGGDAGAGEGAEVEGDEDGDAGAGGEGADGGEGDEDGDAGAGEEEDGYMGKAFDVTLPNGDKMKAYDGSRAVAVLLEQNERLAKAQAATTKLLKSLGAQNKKLVEQVKSANDKADELKKSLDAIGDQGRGRRSAVVIMPNKENGDGEGLQPREFMAKAMSLYQEGKLTSDQITMAEAAIGSGRQVPESIVRAVVGA